MSKGVIQVLWANLINLFISIGNGFLLPKYLPVESYAELKTFLLYTSYVGILHFGYIDGIYIKYGGKSVEDINVEKFAFEKKVLVVFQLSISIIAIVISAFFRDLNLMLAAISVLPVNMISFYKLTYQAMGEFREYRRITNFRTLLIFFLNIVLLLIVKTDNSLWYTIMQVFTAIAIWLWYESKDNLFIKCERGISKDGRKVIKENITLGVVVMLGNFMGIWITSIDRWFVKMLGSVKEFAYYSFAVTMVKLLNVVISAFSVTLYNFFCRRNSDDEVCCIRRGVLIIGATMISIIFPLKYVIHVYLGEYIDAIPVITVIFGAQFLLVEINAVYLNLYKALRKQKQYLFQMVVITVVSVVSNIVIGHFMNYTIISFAIATFITALLWLILCQIGLGKYKMCTCEWIYVMLLMIGYFSTSKMNIFSGMLIYITWLLAWTLLLFFKEIRRLINPFWCNVKNENIENY